jgi:ABC-type antimicrobial peptide transport system permease subunit
LGSFNLQGASPTFFETMGTRLLRGRGIELGDRKEGPGVMVVSQAMANVLWPNADPIGQCVRVGADTNPCTEVVGVAENIRAADDFGQDKQLFYYRPISQVDWSGGGVFVRTAGDASRQAESVRRALQPLMPGASYVTVQPMTEIYGPAIKSWRLGATMFVAFGGLALVLAAIGLYSVIAYNVTQRTHELGVRVAFGAQVGDVIRLILREGLLLTAAGLVIGGAVAGVAARWVGPLLFRVSPRDPAVFAAVAGVLLLVATVASLVPALRAARVDPNVALRSD